jgi:pimeloyl-ACP methyl ester carboxylesterase
MDQTFRGRSSASPNASFTVYSAEYVQQHHTAPGLYNLWPQASLHTQWNGTGTMGDPIFDTHYASGVQFLTPGAVKQQLTVQKAGAALLDHIGTPVILVGHSQGGTMPWLIADARPNLTRAIIAVEPSGPPFQEAVFKNTPAREFGLTDAPLTYNPPVVDPSTDLLRETLLSTNSLVSDCTLQASERPRQLVNLKDVDVLVVTSPSGYHAQYDWCTVLYLQQAGVNASNLLLPEHGLEGNGHLMFLEKNSDDIAQLLLARMQSLK